MAKLLIKNNEARVRRIGARTKDQEITLKPGINEVDAEAWERATEILVVQQALKAKQLEVVRRSSSAKSSDAGDVGDGGSGNEGGSLGDMNAREAIELVEGTYDRELLARWRSEDQRKTVQEAIDKQVELIEQAGDEGEGDET